LALLPLCAATFAADRFIYHHPGVYGAVHARQNAPFTQLIRRRCRRRRAESV
jgi:hypothetical protein